MIQTERKVLPDKPGIYIVSVLGQVYGVLFVIMHEGLQYRFANYLERNPEFRPFIPEDKMNEWDEFWLIGDEPTGILNDAEEAKRVLDRAVDESVKHEVHFIQTEPYFDMTGEVTVSGMLNVNGLPWDHLKLEPQIEWFDIPTMSGVYIGKNIRKSEYHPVDYEGDVTEFIVEILGEAPFFDINIWELGTDQAYKNVDPKYLRLHINSGYKKVK